MEELTCVCVTGGGCTHWAKMGPFPSESSIFSKVKIIAILKKYNILWYKKSHFMLGIDKNLAIFMKKKTMILDQKCGFMYKKFSISISEGVEQSSTVLTPPQRNVL